MKRNHLVLWLTLTGLYSMSAPCLAQENSGFIMNYGKFTEKASTVVYTETAPVYSGESTEASVVATLKLGMPVTVEKTSDDNRVKMDGMSAPWCFVRYSVGGQTGEGYMWTGHLAMVCIKDPASEGDLYLYGISAYDSAKFAYDAKIKYLKNGKLVSSANVDVVSSGWFTPGEYGYCIGGEIFGNRRFAGVDQIVKLQFRYGACGYENTDKYIFRCGNSLSEEIVRTDVSEAGVFHFETEILFPGDKNGIANGVIKTEKSLEFDEAKKDYVLKEKKIEKYFWDQKTLKLTLKK